MSVTATGWGLVWPVIKLALQEWPPFGLRVVTSAAAVAVLLPLAAARGEQVWPRGGQQWRRLALAGVLNITSFVGLGTLALVWLNASEAAIVAYTMPIWATALAWPILGERPTAGRLGGMALGLAGVGILLAPVAAATAGGHGDKLPGFICILGTAVLFAFGAVLSKRLPAGMPRISSLAWQIAIGTLPLVAGALLLDHWQGVHIGPRGWLAAAYIAGWALCVCYFAWFRALELLEASTATIATLMVPVVGTLSAAPMLGETLGWRPLTALAMTVSGIVLATRR